MTGSSNQESDLDRPILAIDDDKLGRKTFVLQLASALVDETSRLSTGAVIGLMGEWGSGKSSVLNFVEEHLKTKFNNAMVLRFDPWLISGRDALVRLFLTDLSTALGSREGKTENITKLREKISQYDDAINAGIEIVGKGAAYFAQVPGISKILKSGKDALKSGTKTLHDRKADIERAIGKVDFPIVVLIDEVDRLEDSEILEIMRLVKSVADFPGISYLIAYDVERVIEALGSGVPSPDEAASRGRAYLEKIVQHQIHLPALFADELIQMFREQLSEIIQEYQFPDNRYSDAPYAKLENAVFPKLLRTPRDLKRSIGIFRTLRHMVGSEVSWIDLLGYSVLLTKVPGIADKVRNDPVFFSSDFARGGDSHFRYGAKAPPPSEQLAELLGQSWEKSFDANLIKFLFPRFDGRAVGEDADHTRILHYRALCFLVRQGTPPGSYPVEQVEELFNLSPTQLVITLNESVYDGKFNDLNYVLSYHYRNFEQYDHILFWTTLASWCGKPDHQVPTQHYPQIGYLELLESTFGDAADRSTKLSGQLIALIRSFSEARTIEFAARLLRDQISAHGLFEKEPRDDRRAFAPKDELNPDCPDELLV